MADLVCARNPRTCNRVCSNADQYNSRLSVPQRSVAPSRFSPAEFLAEPFRTLRKTVRPTPDSWLTETERSVSSVQRPSFTQLCARRNRNFARMKSVDPFPDVNELHGYAQATRIGRTCSDLRSVIRNQTKTLRTPSINRSLTSNHLFHD